MKYFFYCVLFSCPVLAQTLPNEEQVIERYLKKGAWKVSYLSPEYQQYIDSGIAANPNVAYLYQQKSMPYFKQNKCEYAMPILDKAVALDPLHWIDYRAFIKCVFARTYVEAIQDLETSKKIKGEDGFVMDHTYNFYLGLCYLQLNQLQKSKDYFEKGIAYTTNTKGENWVHPVDFFYMGICLQEMQRYEQSVKYFDLAIKNYPRFSDAKFYKAKSLKRTGNNALAETMFAECEVDYKKGYTMTDDNVIYERYPYQLRQFEVDGIKKAKK